MATISSELEERGRPKLNLMDLPREIKDQIYGYLVSDTYSIVPSIGRPDHKNKGDDFRHLSILRVSKRANWEAMQSLQRRSWFIYRIPDLPSYNRCYDHLPFQYSLYDNAITRHMMNVQIVIDQYNHRDSWSSVFWTFNGRKTFRRSFLILIPDFGIILASRYFPWSMLWQNLRCVKSLTGFNTVMVQANLGRNKEIRKGDMASDEYCTKLLTDQLELSEPALGPAMPCDPVYEGEYDLNFKFSPQRFAAEQCRLATEQRPRMTFEDQRWHKKV